VEEEDILDKSCEEPEKLLEEGSDDSFLILLSQFIGYLIISTDPCLLRSISVVNLYKGKNKFIVLQTNTYLNKGI